MGANLSSATDVGQCIADLLREIERAQEAAINFDLATLEDSMRQHSRLGQLLKDVLTSDPAARPSLSVLRPALRRYSLLLRGSERLAATIARVVARETSTATLEV